MRSLSYWEKTTWLNDIDFAVVGSGIVGLSCAISLRDAFPKRKIVVFERGMLPSGASTKNAGFACFGSVSEILNDIESFGEETVVELIKKRVGGLELLRKNLGDTQIDYQCHGGYEIFRNSDRELHDKCLNKLPYINKLLKNAIFDQKDVFFVENDPFSFKNIQKKVIFNQFEGQLDAGKMMATILKKCAEMDIYVLNCAEITHFSTKNDHIRLNLNDSYEFSSKEVFFATNGFAKQLIDKDITPARAQVLITNPIPDLPIKGTFHLEEGYYYFRNVNDRILIGGGRNLDFKKETTTEFGLTNLVQDELESLLKTTILPNTAFTIDSRWSGIMGVGGSKQPIVQKVEDHVYCGIRLGGMGVAIGSAIGKELASLSEQ